MRAPVAVSDQVDGSAMTRYSGMVDVLLLSGLLASLTWIGTDVLASLRYEGYRYPFDPISGLSVVGAPTRPLVIPLGYVYTALKIAFAGGVWLTAGQKRAVRITACLLLAYGLTDLAAYSFPWNPAEPLSTFGNRMHGVLAGGLAVLLIMLTVGLGASADGRWFRFYSCGTLLGMIVMGAVPLLGGFDIAADQPPEGFGVGERINGYGYMLWMATLSIVLWRAWAGRLGAGGREHLVDSRAAANRI